jgi:hypothetical protein
MEITNTKKTPQMFEGFFAFYFIASVIVILFMGFQLNETCNRGNDVRLREQDEIKRAAKLIIQSATQNHPLFKHDHALEAKFLFDQVIASNRGIVMAEKNLKLPKGDLDQLRTTIYEQVEKVQAYMMDEIIDQYPQFDTEANETAGLQVTRSRPRTRTRK